MRRSEALEGVRVIKFKDILGRYEAAEFTQSEAAELLGIGERTLYRVLKDWELQDRIKSTLAEVDGDVAEAARRLDLDEAELQRKMKKQGLRE